MAGILDELGKAVDKLSDLGEKAVDGAKDLFEKAKPGIEETCQEAKYGLEALPVKPFSGRVYSPSTTVTGAMVPEPPPALKVTV